MIRRFRALADLNEVCTEAVKAGMPTDMVRSMRYMARRAAKSYPRHTAAGHARLMFNAYLKAAHE